MRHHSAYADNCFLLTWLIDEKQNRHQNLAKSNFSLLLNFSKRIMLIFSSCSPPFPTWTHVIKYVCFPFLEKE